MSEHGAQLLELLKQVEGGQDVLDAMERGLPRPETEAARRIRDEGLLMFWEREGTIRRGPGGMSEDFLDLPRPDDPEGSVRRALEEDRR